MHDHLCSRCVCLSIAAIGVGFGSAARAHSLIEANGSVDLSPPDAPALLLSASVLNPPIAAESEQPKEVAAPSNSNELVPLTRAASETRPLGPAPQRLDQETASSADAETKSTLLESFDPRSNEAVKVIGALAVVLGLLFMVRAVLRRAGGSLAGGGRPSGVLQILAKYPIGRGQNLILLQIARRVVLLHQSGNAMTALTEMTDREEVAALLARMESGANQREAARFKSTLETFMSGHERPAGAGADRTRSLPLADAEFVDLTRRRRKPLKWFWAGRSPA